jgi:VPDSG-CTERM motif
MKLNNMTPSNRFALVAAVACMATFALTQNASAARRTLPPSFAGLESPQTFYLNHPLGSGQAERDYLVTNNYLDECCQYLGKFEAGTGWSTKDPGALLNISNYITVTQTSGTTWDISWNLTGSGYTLCGVLIKDGAGGQPGDQLYRFYDVSADEALVGSGTVSFADIGRNGFNISHISFFGCAGAVPDGGTTVMLLGAALGALGMVRRFLMG